MGRTPNTNSPVEETEAAGTGTGVTPTNEQTEATERQELESLDPAAQAGEVSPENVKNDATADATLEGADTPQLDEDPVADATDADDLAAQAAATQDQEQAQPTGPKTHTVKQGETAGDIAEKFNIDFVTLGKLNPTLNLHSLLAGDKVTLRSE